MIGWRRISRWGDRLFGYWVNIGSGQIVGTIGYRTREPDPLSGTVRALWLGGRERHFLAFEYEPGVLRLFVAGQSVGEEHVSRPLSPSLTYVQRGDENARFDLDELRWADRALSPDQIAEGMESADPTRCRLSSFSFDEDRWDFAARINPTPGTC